MSDKARYTFAFMADIQNFAKEKYVKVHSFRNKECKSKQGSYDYLMVSFIVPRPDRDVEPTVTNNEV